MGKDSIGNLSVPREKYKRGRILIGIILVYLAASAISFAAISDAVNKTTENQALAVAEIVARQATSARSVYSDKVAKKLKEDGTGPHADFLKKPGFVPIPAQFLKMVGLASADQNNYLYKYKPVSKWNLEKTQGIDDDFLKWAWPQLEVQDQEAPEAPIPWKAVSRFEYEDGNRVLRYLYADPASQKTCVTCHNAYENHPQIKKYREASGITNAKEWKLHQLMGALSITIPLSKIEFVAHEQILETSVLIFAILTSSLIATLWFSFRLIRQESDLTSKEGKLLRLEEQRLASQKLLAAKQDVERAFLELSTYMQGINQHAMVSVTDRHNIILEVNDKFCQSSGFTRMELIGTDQSCIKSDKHSEFFYHDQRKAIEGGDVWSGEICYKNKHGGLYWVDASIVPLKGTIERYISIGIDITERKKTEERMAHMGTHDALTGLPNRILLQDRLRQAVAHDKRYGKHAAVMFIDLDQFKIINDTLGHDIGDLLLIEVTSRLLACVRDEDTVARQGGDEFIILLPNIPDPNHSEIVAKSILESLIKPYVIQRNELHISASIGISIFPNDSEDVSTLMKMSDTAMYHAKESGRNNYQRFRPELNAHAEAKHKMLLQLKQAITNNEFELYYQPIVDIRTNKLLCLEALMRWNHPELGFVQPSEFIPLAEETGLILTMGDWVINAGCTQMKTWQDMGYDIPHLAVNLSVRQFYQRGMIGQITKVLEETGLDGKFLELEITEGILMENTDELIATMYKIKDMGVKISVDDFGTGYSSLSYIKSFPIDTLKIDRSFVMDISTDPGDAAIVKAIIALGHSLQMNVLAEGVETQEQLDFLKKEGCDCYQGYYFSKPLPASAITAFLQKKID